MSVTHDHEHECKAHMTSRLQQTHNKGWRFAWVVARTPTVHRCSNGETRGSPDATSTRRPRTTRQTSLETNELPGNKCRPTLVIFFGSGAARRSHGDRAVRQLIRSRLVNTVEVETSRIIKKILQRNETNLPGEDQPRVGVHQASSRISTRAELLM